MINSLSEIWKDIPGYEGLYKVSNFGRAKSLNRTVFHERCGTQFVEGRILSFSNARGYLRANLYKNNKKATIGIHRLVLLAFVGDSKLDVDHIDNNKGNNNLTNLRYCTPRQNAIWRSNRTRKKNKHTGVYWRERDQKFDSTIAKGKKKFHLGSFVSEEEAIKAYQKAFKELENVPT